MSVTMCVLGSWSICERSWNLSFLNRITMPNVIWEPFTGLKCSCYWRRQSLFHCVPTMSENWLFEVRTSSKFCSTSEQEGFCWAPNKGWMYQTLHKSVFCTLQAAASLVWRKVYLQSCSQKGYYYYKNKHQVLWYIRSQNPLISPDFFRSKASRQSLFQQEAKNTAI